MKPPIENPYEVLGVDPRTPKDAIKKVYRKKAAKCHPDIGGDANEFARLGAAWGIVGNDAKRAEYDSTGEIRQESDDLQKACTYFGQCFSQAMMQLAGDGVLRDDNAMPRLVRLIKEFLDATIANEREDLKNKLQSCTDKFKFTKRLRSQIRRKKDGNPVLENIVDSMIRDAEDLAKRHTIKSEQTITQLKMAREMADQYEDSYMEEDRPVDNRAVTAYQTLNTWGGSRHGRKQTF